MPHSLVDKLAPTDLQLQNQDGEIVDLKSVIGHNRPVVLFFYPKDESYGCTKEVCSFRDSYQVFKDAGAIVIGVSGDTYETHKRFASNQQLQFPLLSDVNGEARKAFEVSKSLGMIAGRSTFLIDPQGIIRKVFNSQTDWEGHVKASVEFIQEQSQKRAEL